MIDQTPTPEEIEALLSDHLLYTHSVTWAPRAYCSCGKAKYAWGTREHEHRRHRIEVIAAAAVERVRAAVDEALNEVGRWIDGRLVNPAISEQVCVHNVGVTPGMWCGACNTHPEHPDLLAADVTTEEWGTANARRPLSADETADLLNSLLGTDAIHTMFARALLREGYAVVPTARPGADVQGGE